ncbi:MAG: cytochrome P450 [Chloroflexota bacterium]
MLTKSFETVLQSDTFYDNPHAVFHRMREDAPVYWSDVWQAWVLTRYGDVQAVLRDSENYSSAGRVRYLLERLSDEERGQVGALERHYDIGLAHSDPPDHTRLRRLLTKVFTPKMVAQWQERIESTVNALIDEVADAGKMDIIEQVAYPLPATIIALMIGAPEDDIALFRDWAVAINALFEQGGRVSLASAKAAQDSLAEMRTYIDALSEKKRATPADDIISRLVAADDDERLTPAELVSTCVTLFVAGHETTTNLLGNGMWALLTHPEQMALLREHPEKIDKAVEEMLRFEPSVPRAWRIAKKEMTIGGQTIRAGDMVFPMLSAANRDPSVFAKPDVFDIERTELKHVAFGYGIHFCLGAPLARLEGAVVINVLLARLPEMRLKDDTVVWGHDVAIRRLDRLPVIF